MKRTASTFGAKLLLYIVRPARVALFMAGGAVAQANGPEQIANEMAGLVEESLRELEALQSSIADEKAPLVSKLGELEESNVGLRSEVSSYEFLSQRTRSEIESLTERRKTLQEQTGYVEAVLQDYLQKFDSRIHLAEGQRYFDQLDGLRRAAESGGAGAVDRYAQYLAALELGIDRIGRVMGGEVFRGKAIDDAGRIFEGKLALYGPSAFFLDEGTGKAGVLKFNSGAVEPGLTLLEGSEARTIAGFIASGSGELPLDPSLGDALAFRDSRGDLLTHIRQGGVVGYFILLLGGIAIVVSLLKLRDLSGFRVATEAELQELSYLARTDRAELAAQKAKAISGVASDVLTTGIRNIRKNALLLEETMLSVILRAKPKMDRYLPFLAITAAAAPLLGLLGTVVGLIKTFALITLYGAGSPNALSSGISEALVTTELGLIVAIPTLILHSLFTRLIRSRVGALEQIAFDFVETASLQKEEAER